MAEPLIRLVIDWSPTKGRLEVVWPQVDDTIKLGLLEMAKTVLIEQRAKAGMNNNANIVIPQVKIQ